METDSTEEERRGEVTRLLQHASEGEDFDTDRLLVLLYGELKTVADRFLAGERNDHTLQPTALVHEAYMRLVTPEMREAWKDQRHFLATAARAMRNLLVDHARTKGRDKRGGRWQRVELTVALGEREVGETVDLIALDRALADLAELSDRQAQVVEMRFFGGLQEKAIAEVLGVSERTVERDWRHARAWLSKRLAS